MVNTVKIREEIKTRVDKISGEKLSDILEFIKQFESDQEEDSTLLNYFGIWENIDDELIDDLTINLHENRLEPTREY
ncbi:MAG: hypothetical protein R2828_34320 [Saprospiraceae bacterium]